VPVISSSNLNYGKEEVLKGLVEFRVREVKCLIDGASDEVNKTYRDCTSTQDGALLLRSFLAAATRSGPEGFQAVARGKRYGSLDLLVFKGTVRVANR
jgi:hypothetical protein